jgi:sugar O-acyltransferase (sialic acid O-acetyltransferase NeuD family)
MKSGVKLIVWGAGGHAAVVADIIQRGTNYQLAGFIDDVNPTRKGQPFSGGTILGEQAELAKLHAAGVKHLHVAIGNNAARIKAAARAKELGFSLVTIISPSADVAVSAEIGPGTFVASGTVVTPGVRIGECVIINTSASVDHHCTIADGAHICPGVHLAGGVSVGNGSWVGIGATVTENIRIGLGATIGAGAVVVRDIPDNTLAYGVPARLVRRMDRV